MQNIGGGGGYILGGIAVIVTYTQKATSLLITLHLFKANFIASEVNFFK